MIETLPKNNRPINRENRFSALKIIILPLFGFIFIVIITAVLLFSQISTGQQSLLNWVNISIIIVSLLLFIPGLLLLILILGLITVMNKSRQSLFSGLRKIQQYVFKTSKILTNIVNIILKPIFFLESALIFFRRPKT